MKYIMFQLDDQKIPIIFPDHWQRLVMIAQATALVAVLAPEKA